MVSLEQITSRDNRRIVAARKVRDGHTRDRIFIEGKRLVEEALRSGVQIDECFVADDFSDAQLRDAVGERARAIAELPRRVFQSIADTKEPQGITLIAKRPETGPHLITVRDSALPLLIYLHEVSNPSNLGAILRTAEAAGVAGIIISQNSADAFSPKALRAAMGANLRLPIWDDAVFGEVIDRSRENKLIVSAAVAHSKKSYAAVDWTSPRLLIFGSEAHGLTEEHIGKVDETFGITMERDVESLNLAVSAGIILFEARRQNLSDSR